MLVGVISVEAALRSSYRSVFEVIANRDRLPQGFGRVKLLASERGVAIRYASATDIERLAGGHRHGGLLATVGARAFQPVDSVLTSDGAPFLVMIDGVEDPFNFGQSVRSIYAAGATGLLLRPRNWMSAAGVVARASAGASELIPTALVDNLVAAHELASEHGVEVVVLEDAAERTIFEHNLTGPVLLVVGGEHRGVTRSFKSLSYSSVSIPYERDGAHSLGTSAALSIAAFEVLRQRRLSGREPGGPRA